MKGGISMHEDELQEKLEQAKAEGRRERAMEIAKNIIRKSILYEFTLSTLGLEPI